MLPSERQIHRETGLYRRSTIPMGQDSAREPSTLLSGAQSTFKTIHLRSKAASCSVLHLPYDPQQEPITRSGSVHCIFDRIIVCCRYLRRLPRKGRAAVSRTYIYILPSGSRCITPVELPVPRAVASSGTRFTHHLQIARGACKAMAISHWLLEEPSRSEGESNKRSARVDISRE